MNLRHGMTASTLTLLLGAAAAACSPAPAPRSPSTLPTVTVPAEVVAPQAPSPKAPWRIGAFLSLTGDGEAFGIDARDGVDLALAQVNAGGGVKGRPVEVTYRDDASSAERAADEVLSLIAHDAPIALLGDVASSRSRAGGIVANKLGVPMITPTATSLDVTAVGPFVFRTCFTDEAQGRAAATFLVSTTRKKRIAVLFTSDDGYSTLLAGTFREEVSRLGGQIVVEESVSKRETDFTAHLAELRKHRPDVIYAPIYYNAMTGVAAQAKAAGMRGDLFFGSDGWDSDELLKAGDALEGAAFTNHWVVDAPEPRSRAFAQDFRARFNHDPTALSALGFDTLKLLADAFGRSRDDTREGVRQAIQSTSGFVGATGRLTMGRGRNPARDVFVVQIKDGAFAHRATVVGSPSND